MMKPPPPGAWRYLRTGRRDDLSGTVWMYTAGGSAGEGGTRRAGTAPCRFSQRNNVSGIGWLRGGFDNKMGGGAALGRSGTATGTGTVAGKKEEELVSAQ